MNNYVIDSPEKADWALDKIREERERRDIFISAAQAKINNLTEQIEYARIKCEDETENLRALLDAYLDTVPAKKTKTQMSIVLPGGKLVRKLPKEDFQPDNEKLLAYLRETSPELIKVEEKPKWGELKPDLEITGGAVVRRSTGEILDCVGVVIKKGSFDVEV